MRYDTFFGYTEAMHNEDKLLVLAGIGRILNAREITWALGASCMLYLRGIADTFDDIDLMVKDSCALQAEALLKSMGELQPSERKNYRTKHFREFRIAGVDVDMIGGFAIVKDSRVYDCDLKEEEIDAYREIDGVSIPLQSLSCWKRYYALMGRENKVQMIDRYQKEHCTA